MHKITWKKDPDLPQGFQDSNSGIIGKTMITVRGFLSRQKGDPGKGDKYSRGFLKKVWDLDLSKPGASWGDFPELAAVARHGLSGVVVNVRLHCVRSCAL